MSLALMKMERKQFRALFDESERGFAEFDRRGFASVGSPFPSVRLAKKLVNYPKVKKLNIGIFDNKISSAALEVLLEGWRETLEQLEIQDHRTDGLREPKNYKMCNSLSDCHKSLAKLSNLWFLKFVNLSVGKPATVAISKLPSLENLSIARCRFTFPAFKSLEHSTSLKQLLVTGCSGVYSEDVESLDNIFRTRCKVVVYKY